MARSEALDWHVVGPAGDRARPRRMCVGCRVTADKSDLLRVVVADGFLSPDPRAQRPGRGAYLHPDPGCLEAAERRRAFVRAFRLTGPLDAEPLRSYVAERATSTTSRSAD